MYLAYVTAGYRGVIVLHTLTIVILAAILMRSIRQVSTPPAALLVGFAVLVAILPGTAERPQLASWCLLAACLPALRRAASLRRAPRWFVPVVWLWANLHGMWSVGLVLYGFIVLGLVSEVGLRRWRTYRSFVGVGAIALLAAGFTPNGLRLLTTPLHVREYAGFVSEWRPPTMMTPAGLAVLFLIAVVVRGWSKPDRAATRVDLFLLLGAALTGLAYTRTVPVFAIAIAPIAAAELQGWMGRSAAVSIRMARVDRVLATGLVITFIALAAWWLPQVPGIKRGAPWQASATLDALPGRAHVLNEYAWGGWLLWTARDTSPVIDGRTEIYDVDHVRQAMGAQSLRPGWQEYVQKTDFDAAWLFTTSPLVFGLETMGWHPIFRNSYSVILVPPTTVK
jgi:hypothetical protein